MRKLNTATMGRSMSGKQFGWPTLAGVVLATAVGVLAGCSSAPKAKPSLIPTEAPAPSLEKIRATALARLEQQGVRVIVVGEQCRVVLPSDYVFFPNSANVLSSAEPILKQVAVLVSTYATESMQVVGYTDKQDAPDYAIALTTRQAQVIAKRLWKHGVDTRLLTAIGLGHANPVDWNGSLQGQHNNRRVEISFRFYPVYKGYE